MYNVVFEKSTGEKFVFGVNGGVVFDMDMGHGVSVDLGLSQGFSQIGQTVENRSVSGRPINVKGVVYGNTPKQKNAMRKMFAPFTSGRLIFEDRYYTTVFVKNPPSFSMVRDDGRFTMQFYAPFPYFYTKEEKSKAIGNIIPAFSFPVNYSEPHKFGTKSVEKYTDIQNEGDVAVPYSLYITTSGVAKNPVFTNLETLEFIKLNGTINVGDQVKIYRDGNNILRAELSNQDGVADILSWVDEDSSLFVLNPGRNIISADDDNGGGSLTAVFAHSPAVVALYES